MIVSVVAGSPAQLLDPDDLKSFKVVLDPALRADTARSAALAGVAECLADNAAWVSKAWVQEASGRGGSPEWQAGFANMLAYAARQGWIREADGAIRAHIEWSPT